MITEAEFKQRFKRDPVHDDLERVNCDRVGEPGHWQCGICDNHSRPRFECSCIAPRREAPRRRGDW
jgi:hypothetical protein